MIFIDEAVGKNSLVREIEEAKEHFHLTGEDSFRIAMIVSPEVGNVTEAIAEYFELDIPENADDSWTWDNTSWAVIEEQLEELLAEFSGRISENIEGFYLAFDIDESNAFCLALKKDSD